MITASADVREYDQVEAAVAQAVSTFGRVDILINNAAGNFLSPTEKLSPRAFAAVVGIVLNGSFNATLAAGKQMISQGGGRILNIVTNYAETGSAFVVPSACGKAGVLAMTRSLAVEWAHYNIRVNARGVPGPFPTKEPGQRCLPSPGELEEEAKELIPLKRFGRLEESHQSGRRYLVERLCRLRQWGLHHHRRRTVAARRGHVQPPDDDARGGCGSAYWRCGLPRRQGGK